MKNSSKTLEICCYAICIGAFGIFVRWMQLMLAYNDESLVDSSFWNVAVVIIIAAAAFFPARFIRQFQDKYYYVPHNFCQAFKNTGKIYTAFRWSISGIMVIGAVMLLAQCETDTNAGFLRIVAVLGAATGVCFGLLLSCANRPAVFNRTSVCVFSTVPIIFIAFWIISIYKENAINPVLWDFAVELAGAIFVLLSFYRIAGFAYGSEDEKKCFFYCMLASSTCLMNLADSRYLGEQIMFFAMAAMLLMYVWLMLENMKIGQPIDKDISI